MNAPYASRQELDFGALLSRTFANLWLVWRQVLAYLAVAAVVAFSMPVIGREPTGLVGLGLYFGGQYWLFHALMKARGLLESPRIRFLTFVGLAAVLIVPITFGLVLLVLPGLFLVARWIAAPAFVVARGEGVFRAAGHSWQAVRGHTAKLAGAVVLIFILTSVIGSLTGGIDTTLAALDAYDKVRPGQLIEAHLLPLLLFGLSTATYELLGPKDTMIEDVFG